MLDLRRLRLLRELAHRGTLAAVAEALSYSPSTVSQQLSQLESEVGVPLLEPVGRRVRLTAAAQILVAHTEQILEHLERAQADVAASAAEVVGLVRVAAFQTAALTLVPPAIARLAERHPRLVVHLCQAEPEQALPALLARDFDLVVAEEYPDSPQPRPRGVETTDLLDDPIRLALPRTVRTSRGPGALGRLAAHPWVMEPAGTASRAWPRSPCSPGSTSDGGSGSGSRAAAMTDRSAITTSARRRTSPAGERSSRWDACTSPVSPAGWCGCSSTSRS